MQLTTPEDAFLRNMLRRGATRREVMAWLASAPPQRRRRRNRNDARRTGTRGDAEARRADPRRRRGRIARRLPGVCDTDVPPLHRLSKGAEIRCHRSEDELRHAHVGAVSIAEAQQAIVR
jgi:hypothetical protein